MPTKGLSFIRTGKQLAKILFQLKTSPKLPRGLTPISRHSCNEIAQEPGYLHTDSGRREDNKEQTTKSDPAMSVILTHSNKTFHKRPTHNRWEMIGTSPGRKVHAFSWKWVGSAVGHSPHTLHLPLHIRLLSSLHHRVFPREMFCALATGLSVWEFHFELDSFSLDNNLILIFPGLKCGLSNLWVLHRFPWSLNARRTLQRDLVGAAVRTLAFKRRSWCRTGFGAPAPAYQALSPPRYEWIYIFDSAIKASSGGRDEMGWPHFNLSKSLLMRVHFIHIVFGDYAPPAGWWHS